MNVVPLEVVTLEGMRHSRGVLSPGTPDGCPPLPESPDSEGTGGGRCPPQGCDTRVTPLPKRNYVVNNRKIFLQVRQFFHTNNSNLQTQPYNKRTRCDFSLPLRTRHVGRTARHATSRQVVSNISVCGHPNPLGHGLRRPGVLTLCHLAVLHLGS